MTDVEIGDTVLFLRHKGYTISGIYAVTGLTITKICEVIYEQNQKDIHRDGASTVGWNGVF